MKIPRRKPLHANVGVVGVGLDTYWDQFEGLYDEMLNKMETFKKKLEPQQVSVCDFGIIDNAEKAYAKLPAINRPT
jgi:L-arabinose isomerase